MLKFILKLFRKEEIEGLNEAEINIANEEIKNNNSELAETEDFDWTTIDYTIFSMYKYAKETTDVNLVNFIKDNISNETAISLLSISIYILNSRGLEVMKLEDFNKDQIKKINEIMISSRFSEILGEIPKLEMELLDSKSKEATLFERFGQENYKRAKEEEIWLGMKKDLFLHFKGDPEDKKENISVNKKVEKFYYGEYTNKIGNLSYRIVYKFENEILVGWKDID